ncbi:MAG: hypothetical protein WAM50_05975, partial [Pseudolabrys sp.]
MTDDREWITCGCPTRKYRRDAKKDCVKCDRVDRYQTHDLSETGTHETHPYGASYHSSKTPETKLLRNCRVNV